jgi:Protein of unknown function (DUF2917)
MNIAAPLLSPSSRFPAGRAFSIQESSGIAGVRIETGKIWLTTTPGTDDIVLQPGDTFAFAQGWPFVLETLSDARIAFLKTLNFQ